MPDIEKKPRKGDPGHRFQPNHERFGGRKKRTAAQARALAAELGLDPLEYLLNLLAKDVVEEVEIDANGKEHKIKVPVGHALKIDICKTLAPFFYPRLSATAVTGANEGPVQFENTLDVSAIMASPALCDAAQELALMVVDQERKALNRPEPDYRFS